MIMESTYRRQALQSLKNENLEIKHKLCNHTKQHKNSFTTFIASILAYFSQH
jgi:hypothetical protein